MEKIRAAWVMEILGKPKEYVETSIKQLVDKIGETSGVNILKRDIKDVIKVEGSREMFTTFAELEIEFERLEILLGALFAFMPAHVEIIEPKSITFPTSSLNDITNTLIQRLHSYDSLTKTALAEREILLKKFGEVAPEELKKFVEESRAKKSR